MKTTKYLLFGLLIAFISSGAYAQTSNRLIVPGLEISGGDEKTLSVEMDNLSEVVAVQFTLELPQGFSINPLSVVLTNRKKDHMVTARSMGSNTYKIMVYSPSNSTFFGMNGELLRMSLRSADTVADGQDYPINVTSAVMSISTGENILHTVEAGIIKVKHLPNLHVQSVDCSEPVAGQQMTVTYKVVNDGFGSTEDNEWKDYIWLVPDVQGGTNMERAKLLATVGNVTALGPGEYYENTVNVQLEERVYGDYDL